MLSQSEWVGLATSNNNNKIIIINFVFAQHLLFLLEALLHMML